MCGIVGFTGNHQAAPILLYGLSRLEYRGYDSAGLAVRDGEGDTEVIKAKGRLKVLADKTNNGESVPGTCGIGHTRWATHGEPSETNAHPHMSDDGNVVAVHNGIIENYQELKDKLIRNGYEFYSSTDTEVAVKLVDYYYKKYLGTPVDAINHAMVRIRGSYALAIMFKDYPGEIYVARKDSPMILGVENGESYIASDVPAILKYTRNVYYIGNLEMARIRKGEITFYNLDGDEIQKEPKTIEWDAEAAEKAGFEHFMIKEILNPENTPERVNELLTLLLGQRVRIVDVLPNDGTRLADESTLLITDMVVQLEDGSIANLEIQKIGYYFPGERSACYSADLLLRQYKRVRGIKGKRFSYRDIKQVYTIVLFEKSPTEFQKFSNNYIHRFMQKSDTGVNINLLQEYLFIPLDIFKKNQQNENRSVKIENRLEAWLAFFCMDDPETIIDIIEKYPDFKEMYEQAYDVCRNIEEVMQMFSKELLELDRNTVKLMIDDMQKQIEEKDEEIGCQREQLSQKDEQLNQKDGKLNQKDEELSQKDEELNQKDEQINQQSEQMIEMRKEIQRLQQLLDKNTMKNVK